MNFLRRNSMPFYKKLQKIANHHKRAHSTFNELRYKQVLPNDQMDSFLKSYTVMLDELFETGHFGSHSDVAHKHLKAVLFHNIKTARLVVPQVFLSFFHFCNAPENLNSKKIHSINCLAWATEMLVTKYVMLDDVMDGTQVRQNQPCWHALEGIGLSALTDVELMSQTVFLILRKHFANTSKYVQIVELFNEITKLIIMGQVFDTKIGQNFNLFTPEIYEKIILYKTTLPGFFCPAQLALFMSNRATELNEGTSKILINLGLLYQFESDIYEVFGDQYRTSSDLNEGKLNWLALKTIEKGSEAQKNFFFENYGKPARATQIKDLYEEMRLFDEFNIFKEKTGDELKRLLERENFSLPKAVLEKLVKGFFR